MRENAKHENKERSDKRPEFDQQESKNQHLESSHMHFTAGLASVCSGMLFAVTLSLAIHFLGKDKYPAALWLGFATWVFFGLGVTFAVQQYFLKSAPQVESESAPAKTEQVPAPSPALPETRPSLPMSSPTSKSTTATPSAPEPAKPEPIRPTQKESASQVRPPLVAPPLPTPTSSQNTQNTELIGEELTDHQRLILSVLYRCGGSLHFHEFGFLGMPRRILELRIEELVAGKYCSLDRFGGNQTRKTKLVIERNGERFGRQEQSPFPVRPLDPLPPWPSPISNAATGRAFEGQPPWTSYTRDNMLGDRLLWVWRYDTRVSDGYPRDLTPFCPECSCDVSLSGQKMFFQGQPEGSFINRLVCPYHSDRPPYDVVGDIQNGECSSIMRRIIINIRNGGWMIAVRRQKGIRL